MHAFDAWGGSFDVSMDSATDDDRSRNMDLDRASRLAKLEETQQSWLSGPSDQKKKKKQYVHLGCVNACSRKLLKYIAWTVLASILLTGFIVMLVKLIPHHHPPPAPSEHSYTQAFHKALLFFKAQKSGILTKSNNISWRASSVIHDGEHPVSEDSYTQALHKALLFFNAQKSGVLTKSNNIAWRASSAIHDGEPVADLAGGYYDAGDNIKFGFPGAFTITMLSWSVIEYSAKYEAIGELIHVKELIKWGTDYILKTFNKTANSINQVYAQVGVGNSDMNNDDSCWERPEDMDYERPVATCGRCSDLAAEMAAALAAASIVFKDERRYAQELLHGAEVVYHFARGPRGRYSVQVQDASHFYNSTGYWDEYVWSSAWLYYASGNATYLSLATNLELAKHANAFDGGSLDFSWDNKLPGAQVILTRLGIMMNPGYPYEDGLRLYNNLTDIMMCAYLPRFKAFNMTKGGLVQLNHGRPAPLQYNAAAAFLSALYADYLTSAHIPGWNCGPNFLQSSTLRDFSRSQIDYILGNNPNKMSYVVGYGKRYPTHVHHRGASIPSNVGSRGCTTADKYRDTKSPNPHVLVGAMVGGPDAQDRFADVRTNYNFTKPTIAGNALLVAALISLAGGDTSTIDSNTIFSAIPPFVPQAPPPPPPPPAP